MKRTITTIITLLLLTFFGDTAFGQEYPSKEMTHKVKDKVCIVYKNPSRMSDVSSEISPKKWIKVVKTYKDFFVLENGYLHKDDIDISLHDYKMDSIRIAIEVEKLQKENIAKQMLLDSIKYYFELYNNSLGKNKIYISTSFDTNYPSAKFIFNIISTHTKKLKYVSIYVQPYNPVNDKIGKPLMFKAVGPIAGDKEIHTYEFENAIISNVLSYVEIIKVVVQFMDNTSITLFKKDVTFSEKTNDIVFKLQYFR